jgi:signal transduction histidine kinase/ActR/RegA family two-component response regulator
MPLSRLIIEKNILKRSGSPLVRYILPFVAIGLALSIQAALTLVLPKGYDFPFPFFYLLAVFAVAWFGGYLPGGIACVLTMVGIPLVATPGFRLAKLDLSRLGLFVGVSLLVSAVAHAQRRHREILRQTNDELDKRVRSRTEDLARSVEALESEIAERKQTRLKLQTQLERMNLLDQTTRAIAERQDQRSIFQVVIRSLEDSLSIDFGSVCLYDAVAEELTVTCVGVRSETLAMELALPEQARIKIDQNGLSRCVRGELVYEPDITLVQFPFPQRLSCAGLGALVFAPLRFESQVFGVLVAARRQPHSFSSSDCEFLRQLTEHVALATHQAQVYAALHQAYDDLRRTQQAVMQQERLRALGQMASGIAHDINNAISPVALYTDWLLETEPNLSERTRGYLETTQRAIEDVAHTVGRMREFYRQQEPQLVLAAVDLNRLVKQVLDLTQARWSDMPQKRGVMIQSETQLAPDLPSIAGIESEIREALINLIFNAVDSMPNGGTLLLRTTVRPVGLSALSQVQVEVVDTGAGMDDETRRRCLEPFFTTKGERGTGLGLAMVYGVTQRHNAAIEIESTVGKGTAMRLIFPARVAGTNELAALASATQALPARMRILVVDDDPLVTKSLRDILESDGHVVTIANSGQEGIDIFVSALPGSERFAIVITDLGMPYIDGRKVASAIKAASQTTPVIMLTGWGQRLVAEGDIPPHVDRVLNKPPKLRELRAVLLELVADVPVIKSV